MKKKPQLPPKCDFHKESKLGYLAFFEDAEKRTETGQEQIQCPDCKYWFWPDMFGKKIKQLK